MEADNVFEENLSSFIVHAVQLKNSVGKGLRLTGLQPTYDYTQHCLTTEVFQLEGNHQIRGESLEFTLAIYAGCPEISSGSMQPRTNFDPL